MPSGLTIEKFIGLSFEALKMRTHLVSHQQEELS